MKEVFERPKEGQYVEIWVFDGKIFSETLRCYKGVLETYDVQKDVWYEENTLYEEISVNKSKNFRFFICK